MTYNHKLPKRFSTTLSVAWRDKNGCEGDCGWTVEIGANKMQTCLFCLTSCVEYGQQGFYKDGIYKIYDNDGNSLPSFCDLKSEPGIAWTLVMSWSKNNRFISAFRSTPFSSNAPENENSPNWSEWDHCRSTPPTGEQHAAIRLMASISQTTPAATSKTSTSSISLVMASVRR